MQTATFDDGTLQYFEYIVWWATSRSVTLKPMFVKFCLATSAAFAATPELSPTIRIESPPVYLPVG